jgi:hypothetical protein
MTPPYPIFLSLGQDNHAALIEQLREALLAPQENVTLNGPVPFRLALFSVSVAY